MDWNAAMYAFTSRVRYSEIDEDLRLSIPSLVDYLQDCSTFHSDAVGRGFEHVRETGLAWLLAGWEIEIDRLPSFGEEIRVSTWASGFKGLLAKRNFTVCDAADAAGAHPLVRADSRWFLFDAAQGKPVRIPEEEAAPYQDDVERFAPLDLPPMQRHIRVADPGAAAPEVVVTGAHIDTNHHVNNAQYVSMALGALPEHDLAGIRRVDVQYSVAAKLGDTIQPHVHACGGGDIVTLDAPDGKPYATVRVLKR